MRIAAVPALTHRSPGLVVTEHELRVPLDHAAPDGPALTVFAREVADPDGLARPRLLFLQGGPGFEATRPTSREGGWIGRALDDYRVVLLDQRGTGRSTPVGTRPDRSPAELAEYLSHFRADAIVRDAELLRAHLGAEQWSVLGQSFGGFTTLNYLSQAPEGLREAFFTGGLPPVGRHTDEVYAATYERMLERCRRYYARYPEDRDRVRAIHDRCAAGELVLPSGDVLTHRRFQQLGNLLGQKDGAERLHHLVELPPDSPAFLHDVVSSGMTFARNPLYALVHEASYADGCVTGWSAQRTLPPEYAEDPTLLTGEHVFPWMFEDFGALKPLRGAAELLAEHPWPKLYDAARLAGNEVPAAAAVYVEDLYVERSFSEETAQLVLGLRPWITNEFEHDALRRSGAAVLDRLIALARDRA